MLLLFCDNGILVFVLHMTNFHTTPDDDLSLLHFRANDTLMNDWLERTKSGHFGAFRDSYAKSSPFSAKKRQNKKMVGCATYA